MRALIRCIFAIASFACMAAAPAQDGCGDSTVYPTGCDPAQQTDVAQTHPASVVPPIQIGMTVYPAKAGTISCMQPFLLLPLVSADKARSNDGPVDEMLIQDNRCAPNDTDLAWRVVSLQGDLAEVELEAAPQLVMWFATGDLTDTPTGSSTTDQN